MTTILRMPEFVARGHRVTVISPEPYHYYSGMGPGMLSGTYTPQEARLHIRRMVQDRGGLYLEDAVDRVFPDQQVLRLASGTEIPYDVVSFNVGSSVPLGDADLACPNILPVKPVVNLHRVRRMVLSSEYGDSPHIVVVGGGPAGVEVAANSRTLLDRAGGKGRITLVAGTKLLKDHPAAVGEHAAASLLKRGTRLLQGVRMVSFTPTHLLLSDGSSLPYDLILVAVGVHPPSLFRDSGMYTDTAGGLVVNEHLQSVQYPEIFGGGDCVSLKGSPISRVGVHAVRQNPVLFQNLMSSLEGGKLESFKVNPVYLLIMNMGEGTGIAWRRNFVWAGRSAFFLKDIIDRRFMRRFQVSGELEEPI